MLFEKANDVIILNKIIEIGACMHPCKHSVNVRKHYIVNNCIIIICGKILTNLINMLNI